MSEEISHSSHAQEHHIDHRRQKEMLHYPNEEKFGITLYEYRADLPSKRGVAFSPLLSIQRYCTVEEVIRKLAKQTKVSTIAEFGSHTFTFFRNHVLDWDLIDEIHQVDIDESIIHAALHMIDTERERRFRSVKGRKPLVINIFHGNVAERDDRLLDADVVIGIELIEHLEPADFDKFPENIFGFIRPKLVILTTPNREFNVLFEFEEGKHFRHDDHKFEFTREEFQNWADGIVKEYPHYSVQIYGIGEPPAECTLDIGFCSQMAIFELRQPSEIFNEITQAVRNYELIGSYSYNTFGDRAPLDTLNMFRPSTVTSSGEHTRKKRRNRRRKKNQNDGGGGD